MNELLILKEEFLMEIKEKLYSLSERIEKIASQIKSEEGTKQSLILPFFQILGYDVFNPLEFCPEFNADYGIRKVKKSIMQSLLMMFQQF